MSVRTVTVIDRANLAWGMVFIIGLILVLGISVFCRISDLEQKLQSKDQQCEWCMAAVERTEGKK